MPKRATVIILSEEEQDLLTRVIHRYRSEQQIVQRARVILLAAQGRPNSQIAQEMHVNVDTVRLWRDRWANAPEAKQEKRKERETSVLQRLQDTPRPGAVPKFTMEQRAQMAALACEAPAISGRPISQWSSREIAAELIKREIVSEISPRHAARLLKKGASNPTGFGTG